MNITDVSVSQSPVATNRAGSFQRHTYNRDIGVPTVSAVQTRSSSDNVRTSRVQETAKTSRQPSPMGCRSSVRLWRTVACAWSRVITISYTGAVQNVSVLNAQPFQFMICPAATRYIGHIICASERSLRQQTQHYRASLRTTFRSPDRFRLGVSSYSSKVVMADAGPSTRRPQQVVGAAVIGAPPTASTCCGACGGHVNFRSMLQRFSWDP